MFKISFFLSVIFAVFVILFVLLFENSFKISKEQSKNSFVGESAASLFSKMGFVVLPLKKKAPDLALSSLGGDLYGLDRFLGKVVLVNFWAIWCPPCVREMPSMEKAYVKFKDMGLEVLAISLDSEDFVKIKKFVKDLKLTFPIAYDPKDNAKYNYEVRSIPTTFLIDREGYLVAYSKGPREWDSNDAFGLIKYILSKSKD